MFTTKVNTACNTLQIIIHVAFSAILLISYPDKTTFAGSQPNYQQTFTNITRNKTYPLSDSYSVPESGMHGMKHIEIDAVIYHFDGINRQKTVTDKTGKPF